MNRMKDNETYDAINDAPGCEETLAHEDVVTRVMAELPDEEDLACLADLFRMFGDTTRVRILSALQASDLCVCDIAQLLGVTVSAVSHQLRLLKAAGLVTFRREGKSAIYALADDHVRTLMQVGMDHVRE